MKKLKKKSTRTTKPVRWQTGRTWWAGPLRKTEARLAVVRGGAGWRWNWTSELTMDYGRGCCIKRNSQSHRGVPWKVHWRPAGELHCSLSGPSPTDSATWQQRVLPCPVEYQGPCPPTTCQLCQTKKYGQNERTEQNFRKRTRRGGESQTIWWRI